MAEEKHALTDLAAQRSLDVHAPLSTPLAHALSLHVPSPAASATLATVLPPLQRRLAAAVPALSDVLCVRYMHRGSGEEFATTVYDHDPAWLQERLAFHLRFLRGVAAPECAQLRALCFHCSFWNTCSAGRLVLGYPPTRPY